VYFGGTGMSSPVWIIVAWIVAGTALTVLAARVIQRRAG
jgi:hypothetical protein